MSGEGRGPSPIEQLAKAFDLRHPVFVPVWRRLLVIAVCFGWAGIEWTRGSQGWAALFAAAGAWSVYQFFVVWRDPDVK